MLKLYNTLTRKKETFKPIKAPKVGVYTCGPTVYDFAHIGNFRAYTAADVLVRYLRYKGYQTTWVMNLTDVDDKTILGANKEKIALSSFTARYKKAFFADLEKIGITHASVYPEATKHILEMAELTAKLLKAGIAYEKEGSIYYSISKFKNYGKLAQVDLSGIKAGARISADQYEKEDAQDFVLWKGKREGEVAWKTEVGEGRPGWHIECSAMSTKYLGQPFDIHTGGVDLVFPHHQNEIAQSEGATGKKFVNFWVHNEHLLVEGEKMAKSRGNFFTLRDIEQKGYTPLALRYLYLSSHHRDKLNFTWKSLEAAQNTLKNLEDFLFRLKDTEFSGKKASKDIEKITKKLTENFEKAMDDDLSTPKALAEVFEFIRKVNKNVEQGNFSNADGKVVLAALEKIDAVLGILPKVEVVKLTSTQQKLIKEREAFRAKKEFQKADEIRKKLAKEGILLEDTAYGSRWKKA